MAFRKFQKEHKLQINTYVYEPKPIDPIAVAPLINAKSEPRLLYCFSLMLCFIAL